MSGNNTKRMLEAYFQDAAPQMFLSSLFRTPAENFHNSESVEIDIVRGEEDVSIAIQDLSAGYRANSTDIYTNKSFIPPIHKEMVALDATDLLKREPGNNPFANVDFRASMTARMMRGMRKIEAKIRRAIELQASQVLQTGTVTLSDASGNAIYSIDYKPKSAHFPTTGTSWATATADPAADIASLANVIRNNGLSNPDQLIMGEGAFENFIKNDDIQSRFDNRRFELGQIAAMQINGEGGQYRGTVEIGNYRYDVWTYGGRYKNPNGGAVTKFIADDKVVVRASNGRFDGTFGAIPNFRQAIGGQVLLPELPRRFSGQGVDMFTNVWMSDDGEHLFGGVGARPLMIPTAIDTFGCLDTIP